MAQGDCEFDLRPQTRLQVYGELQNGEDFPYIQWKVGATISYRMKRILRRHETNIDDENEHIVVLGTGYEYLQTTQSDKTKHENRIIFQGTGRQLPGAGILLTDRNRLEFRWLNGGYDFRYRNKLAVDRAFRINNFHLTPYACLLQ